MLDTLKLQKQERDQILSKRYIDRVGIDEAKKVLNSNLVKVIIGPRRAGKSIFGFILLKNENFAYLNFDDEKLLKITDFDKLLSILSLVYPNFEYVFFDEIQNLPNWELLVNKMQRRGFNIILTGSNSKLLSGELASNLTGRYSLISVFPLSFEEIKNYKSDYKLTDYLMSGGYPEVVINNLDPHSYLKTLFEAILFKDVTKRYNLRHPQKIYELASYLLTNFASVYSFHNLKDVVGLASVSTAQKYVLLLEQTFLFFSLNKFDFKLKKQFGYNKKIYSIDNGMISSVGFQNSENLGRLLENAVFGKLIRMGLVPNKDLFYYKTKSGKEVDFLIKNGIKIVKLIQVSLTLDDPKTRKREVLSLLEASKELKCDNLEIITLDESDKDGNIKITNFETSFLKF